MGSEKKYPLFKMWGSYFGAILSVLLIHIIPSFKTKGMALFPSALQNNTSYIFVTILSYFRTICFGLILGYIIHSIFRRFSK